MGLSQDDLTDAEQQQITAGLLTLQIIAGALIMGVAAFAAITIILVAGDQSDDWDILCWLAVAAAVFGVVISQIYPAMASGGAEQHRSVGEDINLYMTPMIVQFALLEGSAFFVTVIFLLKAQWILLIMVALLIAVMFAKFPTRGKLVRWIKERRQLAALEGNEQ